MLARLSRGYSRGISPALRSMGTYKTSTGLVGLAVDPNGKENLINACKEILVSVERVPSDATYRTDVEKWYSFIANECGKTDDIKVIEDAMGLGQIEEVIEMAKNELELVDYYVEEKGWERVAQEQKEADKMVLEMADSIYFTDPENHPAKILEEKK